jgi:hypothetical protein
MTATVGVACAVAATNETRSVTNRTHFVDITAAQKKLHRETESSGGQSFF